MDVFGQRTIFGFYGENGTVRGQGEVAGVDREKGTAKDTDTGRDAYSKNTVGFV